MIRNEKLLEPIRSGKGLIINTSYRFSMQGLAEGYTEKEAARVLGGILERAETIKRRHSVSIDDVGLDVRMPAPKTAPAKAPQSAAKSAANTDLLEEMLSAYQVSEAAVDEVGESPSARNPVCITTMETDACFDYLQSENGKDVSFVIVDIGEDLPDGTYTKRGTELIKRLTEAGSDVPVVVVSSCCGLASMQVTYAYPNLVCYDGLPDMSGLNAALAAYTDTSCLQTEVQRQEAASDAHFRQRFEGERIFNEDTSFVDEAAAAGFSEHLADNLAAKLVAVDRDAKTVSEKLQMLYGL